MSHWSSGYTTNIGYTRGYYPELNPARTRVLMALAGYRCPEFKTACELGFGQGISCNIHAAGGTAAWYGNDFNPAHATYAKQLGEVAGHNGQWFDDSFEEFLARQDLPDFDYIVLHGIWSWIAEKDRRHIVEFLRKKLKVGGVVYISYNTLPGWSMFAPMRKFIHDYARNIAPGNANFVDKIKNSIGFAEKFIELAPTFRNAFPQIKERLGRLKAQDGAYVAHEYFNASWEPMYFSQLAEEIQSAKLDFTCSANFLDLVPRVNFSEEQLGFLKELTDPLLVEGAKDFLVNQQFRREFWVKGAQKLTSLEKQAALTEVRFLWTSQVKEMNYKFKTGLGEITMSASIYKPVVELLKTSGAIRYSDLCKKLKATGLVQGQIDEVLVMLNGGGYITPMQPEAVINAVRPACERLNAHILNGARENAEITTLVSPVTGGGITMNRFQQLFLLASKEGRKTPEEWVDFIWTIMSAQGQKLIKETTTITSEVENKKELLRMANNFKQEWSGFLDALQLS